MCYLNEHTWTYWNSTSSIDVPPEGAPCDCGERQYHKEHGLMPQFVPLPAVPDRPPVLGTWAEDDLRRAFVEGAAWWEYEREKATMWPSDRNDAEAEAEKRYPGGKLR